MKKAINNFLDALTFEWGMDCKETVKAYKMAEQGATLKELMKYKQETEKQMLEDEEEE